VIDSPAGSRPRDLAPLFAEVHAVLVPVQPGPIDLEASRDFLQRLREADLPHRGRPALALVGNRLRPWTTLSQQALDDLAQWPYPLVASLRDSQAYALLAGLGKSLFDYRGQAVREQQADWDPLFAWLREVNRSRKR
jgi:chromosome partitioning protein